MSPDEIDAFLARTQGNAEGLMPVVAQQWDTREVLMVAWTSLETLRETLSTGRAVYFSRSRGERWLKGETSGHTQSVREARLDCDGDTVPLLVDQVDGACHTGDRSCFDAFGGPVAVPA
jgi:phosphoribosyl-AMP cyclohydrolase